MKRSIGIASAIFVIAILTYFTNRSFKTSGTREAADAKEGSVAQESTAAATASATITKSNLKRSDGDASEKPRDDSPFQKTTHDASRFAKGDLQNMKVENGALQIGNDPGFKPRLEPYETFGVYASPEQTADAPFSAVIPEIEITTNAHSAVVFEIRTKSENGAWSVWNEVPEVLKERFVKYVKMAITKMALAMPIDLFMRDG